MIGSQLQKLKWHLYLVTGPNGKQCIGQSKSTPEHRWSQHKSNARREDGRSCRVFYAAMRKYGEVNFTHEILLYCDESMIDYYETLFIAKLGTLAPNGLNIDTGGNKNKSHSEETKEIQRQKALSRDTKVYRKSEESVDLPKYIVRVKNKYQDGYKIAKHPNCSCKYFVDKLISLEENLQDAVNMLERLNAGYKITQPTRELPIGVQVCKGGYRVRYREIDNSIKIKLFTRSDMTDDEKREAAIAFRKDRL